MHVSVEQSGQFERKVSVTIPHDRIKAMTVEKMKAFRQQASIKGFRKGHVPPEYIEKNFGAQIHNEVLQEAINESFGDALEKESLKPCVKPDFKTIKDAKGDDVQYEVTFEVFPEIELKPFSDISVEEPEVEITEADLDKMFDKFRDQMADWENVTRAATTGDRVKANVTRRVGDAEPTTNDDVVIVLDETVVLPAIAKGLEGAEAEKTQTIQVTYPEDWNEPEVAGKTAELSIAVLAVEEKKPLSDDTLLEKVGDAGKDGIEGLKQKLKEGMTSEVTRAKHEKMKEALMEKLLAAHQFDLPKSLLDQEIKSVEEEIARNKKETEESVEELADKRVRLGLLLNEVIQLKQIKPDGLKVQAEIERIAQRFGSSPEIIKAYYSNRELMRSVEHSVLLDQAISAILEEATKTPVPQTYDALVNGEEAA